MPCLNRAILPSVFVAYGVLLTIWIERHFPLKGLIIDFIQVTAKLNSRCVYTCISCRPKNREVSSAISLAFDDKPFDKSLI